MAMKTRLQLILVLSLSYSNHPTMSSTIQTSNKASYTDLRRVLTEMPPNNTISSRANKSNEQTTRNMQDDNQVNKKDDDVTVSSITIASCPLVDDRGPVPHNEDMFVRVYSVLPEEKSEQNDADKKSTTDVYGKDDRDDGEKDDIPRRENSWMDDVMIAHEQGGCAVDVLKELVPIVVAERIDTSDHNDDAYDDADVFSSKDDDGIKETIITKPSLGFMRHQHYMDTQSFAAKIRREVQASLARKS